LLGSLNVLARSANGDQIVARLQGLLQPIGNGADVMMTYVIIIHHDRLAVPQRDYFLTHPLR
jgi:hypothetical protein